MDEATKQAFLSAVRTILGVIGGYVVGKGLVSEATATQLIGALMAIVPIVWGVWDKYRAERETKRREALAVNVGIAVADRTPGATPAVPAEKTSAVIAAFTPVVAPAAAESATGLAVKPSDTVLPGK